MLRTIYGEAPKGAASLALARQCGLLVFLIGALLTYAALHPALGDPAVLIVAIEKIAPGLGVLGTALRQHPVAAAIATGDSIIAVVYLLYLAGYYHFE